MPDLSALSLFTQSIAIVFRKFSSLSADRYLAPVTVGIAMVAASDGAL